MDFVPHFAARTAVIAPLWLVLTDEPGMFSA